MTIPTDHDLRTMPGRGVSETPPSPVRIEGSPEGERKRGGVRLLPSHDRFSYRVFKQSATVKPFHFRVVAAVSSSIRQRRGESTPRCRRYERNGTTATHDRERTTNFWRADGGGAREAGCTLPGDAAVQRREDSSRIRAHLRAVRARRRFPRADDVGIRDARSRQLPAKLSAARLEPSAGAVGDRGRRAVVVRQGRRSAGTARRDYSAGPDAGPGIPGLPDRQAMGPDDTICAEQLCEGWRSYRVSVRRDDRR